MKHALELRFPEPGTFKELPYRHNRNSLVVANPGFAWAGNRTNRDLPQEAREVSRGRKPWEICSPPNCPAGATEPRRQFPTKPPPPPSKIVIPRSSNTVVKKRDP